MILHISRRNFALAAASFGSAMAAGPLDVFPSTGGSSQSQPSVQTKPKVLVFDVNQTMLDLNALRPQFARVFGDGKALDEWFSLLLHYSLVVTVTDAFSCLRDSRNELTA